MANCIIWPLSTVMTVERLFMDRNTARNMLLTQFKPKEKNIDTPYLGELDGQLMLIGLTGKQRIDLEEQATDQVIGRDGIATNKLNRQKFIALAMCACLRLRSTGEPVLNLADVLGENSDGNGELLSMDGDVFMKLSREVASFIGNRSQAEIKKSSEPSLNGSDTSLSPLASDEPSMNSSEELTQQN
jgi:hypothetical protein